MIYSKDIFSTLIDTEDWIIPMFLLQIDGEDLVIGLKEQRITHDLFQGYILYFD